MQTSLRAAGLPAPRTGSLGSARYPLHPPKPAWRAPSGLPAGGRWRAGGPAAVPPEGSSGGSSTVEEATASTASRTSPIPSPSSSPASSPDGENLFAKLWKPLRDFGIGRTSLVQGSVGLFVFAGIGEPCGQLWPACLWPELHAYGGHKKVIGLQDLG